MTDPCPHCAVQRRRADTWELAALAALSTGLDEATKAQVGERMRVIVYGSPARRGRHGDEAEAR